MAFRLGDRFYKEILYFYTESLSTGDPLYVLTQVSEANVEITGESTEVTDKNGNLVKKIWKAKSGVFSGTNAFVNTNLIAASSGSDAIIATSANTVVMPKMFHVKSGSTVTLTNYVDGSVKVVQYYGDGSFGKTYTLGDAASATAFAVSTAGVLSLPTDSDATMYFVKYEREVDAGSAIHNYSNKFPSSVRGIMKATYYNPCDKDELKADYIVFPSAQMSPEHTISFANDSTTMDFSYDLEQDYCADEKLLYSVYSADEIDED